MKHGIMGADAKESSPPIHMPKAAKNNPVTIIKTIPNWYIRTFRNSNSSPSIEKSEIRCQVPMCSVSIQF